MKKLVQKDKNERREDVLRPSPYLGYDRDQLGAHLMRCEAFELAQSQFERAVWLNPYEKLFQFHLAHCLSRQDKLDEAMDALESLLKDHPDFPEAQDLRRKLHGSRHDPDCPHTKPKKAEE